MRGITMVQEADAIRDRKIALEIVNALRENAR
jgi:hypothetical protein